MEEFSLFLLLARVSAKQIDGKKKKKNDTWAMETDKVVFSHSPVTEEYAGAGNRIKLELSKNHYSYSLSYKGLN